MAGTGNANQPGVNRTAAGQLGLAAAGVAGWFAIQTFENIGMSLGIMPVTGVPLPFVSYGGSSMFVSWMALGLVVAIGREIDDRVTPLIR